MSGWVNVAVYGLVGAMGVVQLPVLMDIVDNLFPDKKLGRLSNRIIGALLVGMLLVVMAVGYVLWTTVYLPDFVAPEPLFGWRGSQHLIFASWLYIMTVYNYVMAAFHPPGGFRKPAAPAVRAATTASNEAEQHAAGHGKGARASSSGAAGIAATMPRAKLAPFEEPEGGDCRHCNLPRPQGAQHCHVCGGCVQDMDHHCPFVNNCVGRDNFTYFYGFLGGGTMGMVYTATITWPLFHKCWIPTWTLPWEDGGSGEGVAGAGSLQHQCGGREGPALGFVAVFGFFQVLMLLLVCQTGLLAADLKTTQCLFYLRGSWSPFPYIERLRAMPFAKSGCRASRMLYGPRKTWWHFFFPGVEYLQILAPASKSE